MEHHLIRATILPQIINNITDKYKVDENKALHMFYTSHTGKMFSDDDSGLYGQSPLYIFSLFEQETSQAI
ncbi:MAG: hypothetical protein Q7R95_05025 [bacterium]|nr:hypothetical protein [bacterium]